MPDLIETIDMPEYRLCERRTEGGRTFLRIEGVLGQADTQNGNGRVYPRALMEREVAAFQERIKRGRAFSQTEHPDRPDIDKTSVIWTDLKLESDGKLIGTALIPETTAGKNLAAIYEAGGRPGFSTRGPGSVKRGPYGQYESTDVVQPDWKLKAIDVVGDPSVSVASTDRVFRESQEPKQMDIKTFAELKAKYPDLAESVLAEAKELLKSEIESMIESDREKIRGEVIEEFKAAGVSVDEEQIAESNVRLEFCEAVMELARAAGLADPPVVLEGDQANERFAALEARIEELETDNATLADAVAESEAEKTVAEMRTKAKRKAKEFTKGDDAMAESITDLALPLCESMDDVDDAVAQVFERMRAASPRLRLPNGRTSRPTDLTEERAPITQRDDLQESRQPRGGRTSEEDEGAGALARLARR